MAGFDKEYIKLNKAQKAAVEAIYGPVLVIAGPGTGKTQLLSMRVANIMRKTDADASNILCLTFTNKAAANMRERLLKLVGSEANKVTVKTFHGFAAELMGSYPDYFWNGAKLSTAPDAVQLETVQKILADLPLSNPLSMRFAGQYTATNDTLKALRLAKEAGLTPDKLRAIINSNLAYIDIIEPLLIDILSPALSANKIPSLRQPLDDLPEQGIDASISPLLSLTTVIQESFVVAAAADEGSGKTKNTGKWKSRWVQTLNGQKGMFDERRRNAWWLAFCDVYARYREELHLRGYYDYSDMLLEVIVQLEQKQDLVASVQERYQYVLIDEFQDSNAAQLRLAHLVSDHYASEGSPNLMAVGDDDQSIFGFNGAELNNMLFFERTYSKYKKIVLEENYRSSQAILDCAEKIITQATDRLVNRVEGLSKNLIASNPPKNPGEIKHFAYPTREHQFSGIARQIKQRQSVEHASIAVIARGHESLQSLSAILLNLGVPVRYEQQSNILEHQAVKQIILVAELATAIRAGDKQSVNEKISRLIRHPAWKFEANELWQIATQNFSGADWLASLQGSESTKQKQLAEWLSWLAGESSHQPLPVIFDYIIGLTASHHMTSPLRQYYLDKNEVTNDYVHCLSAIRLLRGLITEFSAQPGANLDDFVRFVTVNNENGRGITDESLFVAKDNAVEFYTVHKAKGLEFDQVFIIDAIEDNWRPKPGRRKPPANLPLQPPGEEDDDYVRLLYVAATRAKHTLIVSSYQTDDNGNEVLASPFISQAIPVQEVSDIGKVDEVEILEENLRWPRLGKPEEKANLKHRLPDYRLSATHLLNFLDVANGGPQYFFERHILRLPEARSAALGFGSAMHSALQLAQKLVNQDAFDLGKIITWYEKTLKLEHLSATDYQKFLVHGQETLEKLFTQNAYTLLKGGVTEQYMSDIKIENAILNGAIDHLQQSDNSILITDYKTGTPLSSFTTKDRTKAIKAWRHRSQLIFYALLLKHSPKFSSLKNINSRMVYVEAEAEKDLAREYQPSSEEIERMGLLANAVWQKIMKLDFPDISNYSKDIEGIKAFEQNLLDGTKITAS